MVKEPIKLEKKKDEYLRALYAEIGDKEIELGPYVLQLGEHIGISKQETQKILASLMKNGLIRYGDTRKSIAVTLIGKKSMDDKTTDRKYNIFISHIHENEPVAIKLKESLNAIFSDEINVFISGDPENIPPGQDWYTTIIDGIRRCDCMVILCSPDSVERKWIYFEAGAAAVLDRKIIPICFAGLNAGGLPSPLNYIRSQAIDTDDEKRFKKHFDVFIDEISDNIGSKSRLPFDVLTSDFYQELIFAHPKNQRPSFMVVKTF